MVYFHKVSVLGDFCAVKMESPDFLFKDSKVLQPGLVQDFDGTGYSVHVLGRPDIPVGSASAAFVQYEVRYVGFVHIDNLSTTWNYAIEESLRPLPKMEDRFE
jgi:hypothetical protein